MKYAIIIPDGAADDSLKQLDGRTPIEAANTRNMDWIASNGRQGTVRTVPQGFESPIGNLKRSGAFYVLGIRRDDRREAARTLTSLSKARKISEYV